MAAFPELPGELRDAFPSPFWNWWQAFRSYLLSGFITQNDIEISTAGKGVVIASPNGNRWRITINNAGAVVITAL